MEFALVNGVRASPQPKLKGACEFCARTTIAKCGPKIMWHWSHAGKKHCDPWWQNETEWHRQWKSYFPGEWREKRRFDDEGNEWHIADVLTPNLVAVEFQNSPMPLDELRSRENFYGNMVWIVNGAKFVSSFHILGRLPNPAADWVNDIVFFQQRRDQQGQLFWRRSENQNVDVANGDLVLVHGIGVIQENIDQSYIGHHFYDWVKPHSVWLDSLKPVYIDFGDDFLWRLTEYGGNMKCAQIVSKAALVSSLGGTYVPKGVMRKMAGRTYRNGSLIDQGDCNVIVRQISSAK